MNGLENSALENVVEINLGIINPGQNFRVGNEK